MEKPNNGFQGLGQPGEGIPFLKPEPGACLLPSFLSPCIPGHLYLRWLLQ